MPQMTEEQMKAMQEKLNKMSPEELKAFQKQNCIFCQILAGKVSAKKIYEDSICAAILDINPANPGHILLLPKEHYAIMPLIPEDEMNHMSMVAKALSHVILKVLKIGGTNIFIANGAIAGQRAQHFMIHIIPRKEGDGLKLDIPKKKASKNQVDEIRKRLKDKLDVIFGKKKEEIILEKKPDVIKEVAEVIKKGEKPKEKDAKSKKKAEVSLDDIAKLLK